jgi:hypothetical protein
MIIRGWNGWAGNQRKGFFGFLIHSFFLSLGRNVGSMEN